MGKRRAQRARHTRTPNFQPARITNTIGGDSTHLMDVVIPVHGRLDLLEQCVRALGSSPASGGMHLWLIDDHGDPPLAKFDTSQFTQFSRIHTVINTTNQGFPATVNRGARLGRNSLILILNSDVILDPRAPQTMMAEFNEPQVGVVGPRLIFSPDSTDANRPAGCIQHAGIVFGFDGKPFHVHIGWAANHPRATVRNEFQAVTGACLMTRRALWSAIGGFAEVYRRGTYEDIEYCLMVRSMKYSVIYQPMAVGIHHVGASVGAGEGFPIGENFAIWMLRCSKLAYWDEWRYW